MIELPKGQKKTIEELSTSRAAMSVAVMRIYALGDGGFSSLSNAGHAWISITNYNGSPLKVGGLTIADGKSITVGIWGNTDPTGLWYNTEGYAQSNGVYWGDSVSIQRPLRQQDLDIVNQNITTHTTWGTN
ncbi:MULTISPECIES: hypothetical protein [Bifidobacterium]|uniref:hypothetical protein n=1 Tax=Bifidobacterium TaxID=1678 RepID=UPI0010562C95|nr:MULTISPECIES: hypothetical protein [Bifidobacterium]